MRTIEYGATTQTTHVPAFLTKLWKLVTDMSCDDLISWNPSGTSFIIYDEIRFSKELLPMYFKHNNMASFVRQLNMYGFRKLSTVDQGGMHCFKNEIEFRHPHFVRGRDDYLELIKRKIPNSKSDDPRVKQEYIDELISNIKSLKGKQENSDQGMRHLKRENKALWRHIHVLADRYHKQQAVLQQLVPFFMNMVRSSREVTLKRKAPLMIDEGDMQAKLARLSPPYYVEDNEQDQITSIPSSPGNVTNRGPVIHDVTEMESSKMFPGNILCSPNTSPKEIEAIVDSPLSCSLESSEQTIDSPFTEPGSVKTLNILNHSFERSNSLSPHVDTKHSPVSSSSPLHFPSQVCAMPTSPISVPNYSRVSTGIPPVTIIDETTSDVPLSSNLMANPFVPKVEDTCSESNLYTMDSIVNDRVTRISSRPTIMNETTSSMIGEGTSSMLNGNAVMREGSSSSVMNGSTVLIEGSSSMMNGSTVMREGSLSMVSGNTVMREGSPSIINGSTIVREGTPSVIPRNPVMREGSSTILNRNAMMREKTAAVGSGNAVMREGLSTILNRNAMMREKTAAVGSGNAVIREQTSSMINRNPVMREGTPSLLNPNAMIREGTSSIINESASGSSQNKFFPNFPSSSKSTSANEPWLFTQDACGNNIDNWLGQIFKSDNLIAGCSFPQNIN